MSEVKKPRALMLGGKVGLTAHAIKRVNGQWFTFFAWGSRQPEEITAAMARRIGHWLIDDYAPWAKSLEPEFDERNE